MKKESLLIAILIITFQFTQAQTIEKVANGIWKITYGTPEHHLPTEFKNPTAFSGLNKMPAIHVAPVDVKTIHFKQMSKGVLAEMKVDTSERFYGFGLQTNTFDQTGMRREIRTNSWTVGNIGFGHAPMPFYISTKGYGVLVNSSRYVTFYVASKGKLDERVRNKKENQKEQKVVLNTVQLYGKAVTPSNEVSIQVEGTKGIEIYVFAGPEMLQVMQRYNLFSGGGGIPPMWGLGFKYRGKATFTDKQIQETGQYFRNHHIPCDMIGLEPGWQTASYSCSFAWNPKNFPNPSSFIDSMNKNGFKLNLWEHAYTHPTSPIFQKIAPYSANYTVWGGAVPDFISAGGRKVFGDYHENNFVKKGIAAFKLDECDAADYTKADREWSFPDIATFPSGLDGEQMRQLYGLLYQKTMLNLYHKNNIRTMFDVRASHLFAAPYTSALYSDMYSHADFVRMIVNSGFSGVNWSPELRETSNDAELVRRLQTITMSAHMVANCWYLSQPPWLQYNIDKNNNNELLPNYKVLEQKAKKLIELRMSLLPYLYSAFAKYHFDGTPPFRALIIDYPTDKNTWKIDDEYMMGESLLCAPFLDSSSERTVYLPAGNWYDYNTNKKYEGGKEYSISMTLDQIPMFVKDNTLLPLAQPVEYVTPSTVFNISCKVYGNPATAVKLFEDNSSNFNFEKGQYNWLSLSWKGNNGNALRTGNFKQQVYKIIDWKKIAQ
ncbi:TIM-barrel domain-containing protein [Segetibacter koreensis]|uniref:glycoside hydrolase family 31 protein n=1 Tax=Segetibacter koreensis TaxID=398037 RepID=UPI0003722860|nr:TIM-barrel domain-containing protein [Segetibacter koreensis]